MWGLSCLINFKDTLKHANKIVLSLIAQAKKDSSEAENKVDNFKLEDLIGKEGESAERVRRFRERQEQKLL